MEVWVVLTDYFDGEISRVSVDSIWKTEEAANKYVAEKSLERVSGHSTEYRVEWESFKIKE